MQTSISISEREYPIVQYRGQPVVTFSMIDQMHNRPVDTARRNFKSNKFRFTSEKHFYLIDFSKKDEFHPFGISIPPRGLIVLTERGYLLLAKSLTDDKAWEVQEKLIDGYFRAKPPKQEVEVSGSITLNQQPLSLPYQPLSERQEYGLRNEVNKRAKQAKVHPLKIYAALKDVYEVRSYRDISSDKYTEAKGLVRSMVLNGEVMPRERETTNTDLMVKELESIRALAWESVIKGTFAVVDLDKLMGRLTEGKVKPSPAPKAIASDRIDPIARAVETLKQKGIAIPDYLRKMGYS